MKAKVLLLCALLLCICIGICACGDDPAPQTTTGPVTTAPSGSATTTGSDPATTTGSEPATTTGSDPATTTGSEPASTTAPVTTPTDPPTTTGGDPVNPEPVLARVTLTDGAVVYYAGDNQMEAAILLRDRISREFGITLTLSPKNAEGALIRFDETYGGYKTYAYTVAADGKATLQGAGAYGCLAAAWDFCDRITEEAGVCVANLPTGARQNALAARAGRDSVQDCLSVYFFGERKTYVSDLLVNVDGTIRQNDGLNLTMACIGGSITQGGGIWINALDASLESVLPGVAVTSYNRGSGGTGSKDGSMRYQKDVLALVPDIVVIEYSGNDTPSNTQLSEKNRLASQLYVESMIVQSLSCEKIPIFILVNNHRPLKEGNDTLTAYRNGVNWKKQLCAYYGIATIDIDPWFREVYADYCVGHGEVDYFDWLAGENADGQAYYYYSTQPTATADGVFNVHPYPAGYTMFGRCINEAITADPVKYLTPHYLRLEHYCHDTSSETVLSYSYRWTGAGNSAISYHDSASCHWYDFTKEIASEDVDPGKNLLDYFPDGVKQVKRTTADDREIVSFTYVTRGAEAVALQYPAALFGLEADVYVDGVKKGTVTCQSIYSAAYITAFVGTGITDDLEHTIEFRVHDFTAAERVNRAGTTETSDTNLFRFGYLIERFSSK